MKIFINFLTIFRILSATFVFIFITNPGYYIYALVLFIIAASTDYWDGYLARKYNQQTSIGEILDPIADKILILFALFAIAINLSSYFVGFMSSLILSREIFVGALRDFNSRNNNSSATKVTFLAKLKTSIQLVTVISYIVGLTLDNMFIIVVTDVFLFLTFLITAYTGYAYAINTFKKDFD